MKNIYDIRQEKGLQFILSAEHSKYIPKAEILNSCAIVVNLYYSDTVAWYSAYLNRIPEEITLYIFSSEEKVLTEARKCCTHTNTVFMKKENRGRDLSAFLVAFQPYMDQYEYICFVHDKKARKPWLKEDTEKWNENLWGNMIATPEYIFNILEKFETHPELGAFFPPEPIGEYFTAWFYSPWSDNFKNCKELAARLQLSADIRKEKSSISYGSVFWIRKKVVLKLFSINWKYEDFPEEPMPLDFTISHAIERIFGYMAQDAGYDAGTVMTEQYASWLLLHLQEYFSSMFFALFEQKGIDNLRQFRVLYMQKQRIVDYYREHERIFLYGAGRCGESLLHMMQEDGMEPAGFIVTEKGKSPDMIKGLRVYGFEDLKEENIGIILTVYYPLQTEMIRELKKNGVSDYLILYEE